MHPRSSRSPADRGVVSILVLFVLLNAVVASFVLGVGSQEPATGVPEAAFAFEADDGTVTITHEGGDALRRENVAIQTSGEVGEWPEPRITAGDEITITEFESGGTIEMVWNDPDSDRSIVIAAYSDA